MCGRFALEKIPKSLLLTLGLAGPVAKPRYNIAPTQTAPVVVQKKGSEPTLTEMRWGLVPHWAKDASAAARAINARAESADAKPTFRDAFARRRCLVPASGFYEWKRAPSGKGKTPYYFTSAEDEDGLVFAGLWDKWKGAPGEEAPCEMHSFTILTTAANALMLPVHDRMPVVLHPDAWAAWLNPDNGAQAAKAILAAPTDIPMRCQLVGDFVNNPRHDGEQCLEPRPANLFELL